MKYPQTATYVRLLGMQAHPEGGYFTETYRSDEAISQAALPGRFSGDRRFSTAIYFLLEDENFSALHRIRSDEVWHFYAGDPLEIVEIDEQGELQITQLGSDVAAGQHFQYMVRAGRWFGSRVKHGGRFSLVGCTVAPGFDFADFVMASRKALTAEFPQHAGIIAALTRPE